MLSVPQVGSVKHPTQGLSSRSSQKKKTVPKVIPWADARVPRGGLSGCLTRQTTCLFSPQIRREDELGKVGEELLELLGFAGRHLARGEQDEGAERRLLGGGRQLALIPADLPTILEQGHDFTHGIVETSRNNRAGALRFDQAEAREAGL